MGLHRQGEPMKKLVAAAVLAGSLFTAGAGQAFAAPTDQGNCISDADNAGAAGLRISSRAGRGFGQGVSGFLGGGFQGSRASDPGCRRS